MHTINDPLAGLETEAAQSARPPEVRVDVDDDPPAYSRDRNDTVLNEIQRVLKRNAEANAQAAEMLAELLHERERDD